MYIYIYCLLTYYIHHILYMIYIHMCINIYIYIYIYMYVFTKSILLVKRNVKKNTIMPCDNLQVSFS